VLEASNEFKVVATALEEKERSLQWRGHIQKMLVNSVMVNKACKRSIRRTTSVLLIYQSSKNDLSVVLSFYTSRHTKAAILRHACDQMIVVSHNNS
jgi:hypothetical protein